MERGDEAACKVERVRDQSSQQQCCYPHVFGRNTERTTTGQARVDEEVRTWIEASLGKKKRERSARGEVYLVEMRSPQTRPRLSSVYFRSRPPSRNLSTKPGSAPCLHAMAVNASLEIGREGPLRAPQNADAVRK
jgi:hypothetical protein